MKEEKQNDVVLRFGVSANWTMGMNDDESLDRESEKRSGVFSFLFFCSLILILISLFLRVKK